MTLLFGQHDLLLSRDRVQRTWFCNLYTCAGASIQLHKHGALAVPLEHAHGTAECVIALLVAVE